MEEKRDRLIQLDFRKSAIKRQIMNCINKKNYRAGVYVALNVKSVGIEDDIKDIIKELSLEDYLDKLMFTLNDKIVRFKHGSSIKIVRANECARGNKFHDIVYDHKIENDIVNNVVLPSLVPYYDYSCEPPMRDDETRELFRLVECEI